MVPQVPENAVRSVERKRPKLASVYFVDGPAIGHVVDVSNHKLGNAINIPDRNNDSGYVIYVLYRATGDGDYYARLA